MTITQDTPWPKREPGFDERYCPYDGVAYSKVPGYVSGYGCPVCKAISSYHLPIPRNQDRVTMFLTVEDRVVFKPRRGRFEDWKQYQGQTGTIVHHTSDGFFRVAWDTPTQYPKFFTLARAFDRDDLERLPKEDALDGNSELSDFHA